MVRPWRFNELKKSLDGISQKVLTDSLRQMEHDGLVYRKDFVTNPPHVEYGLTELGTHFVGVLKEMEKFGDLYQAAIQEHTEAQELLELQSSSLEYYCTPRL